MLIILRNDLEFIKENQICMLAMKVQNELVRIRCLDVVPRLVKLGINILDAKYNGVNGYVLQVKEHRMGDVMKIKLSMDITVSGGFITQIEFDEKQEGSYPTWSNLVDDYRFWLNNCD